MDVQLRAVEANIAAARVAYETINDRYQFSREYDERETFWTITESLERLADAVQRLAWILEEGHADGE